jgi:L-threonylcarbamoyladenylate synthase
MKKTPKFITLLQAKDYLLENKIVAIPTETVYGLAGLATSQQAVQKIYKAKNRPSDNPLICHFESFNQILDFVIDTPDYLPFLGAKFCPGAISFLLKIPENSPLLPATTGLKTTACRVPNHPTALEIIKEVGLPLAIPSANTSGKVSPTTAQMVLDDLQLVSNIDGIIDGGQTNLGIESTIIDCRNPQQITILRNGSIGIFEIEQALQNAGINNLKIVYGTNKTPTPGAKYRHYAPEKPVYALAQNLAENLTRNDIQNKLKNWIIKPAKLNTENSKIAILASAQDWQKLEPELIEFLPQKNLLYIPLGDINDINQIAQNLYLNLHKIDTFEEVSCAFMPRTNFGDTSLGIAINQRLQKVINFID